MFYVLLMVDQRSIVKAAICQLKKIGICICIPSNSGE